MAERTLISAGAIIADKSAAMAPEIVPDAPFVYRVMIVSG